MEDGKSGRGRKRGVPEPVPEPAPKPSRKSRRGDVEPEGAPAGAASTSKEGKERKDVEQAAATEHSKSKRTRSAHAASASEDASAAGVGTRSAKESKEPKKEATSGDSKEGRAKSRRAEKQAENSPAAPSNGAAASTASVAAALAATSASTAAASAASAALAMAAAHPGDLFPSSGLRRLLDRGFEELPMTIGMLRGSTNSRFRSLLDGLKAEGDLARQEGALTELCDMLCMATEETLQGFSTDQFLPPLVALINCEASPEIMLQACRGIAYILEAIPQSSNDIVRHGSIAPLCSKLMAIQYIDVAEQALMTLHKISKDQTSLAQLLEARGVSAVLSYLDFFPLSVQRTGMETVANMCKKVSVETLHLVVDSIPQLSQMLLHSDSKLVEHVCAAFCRLVTSLAGQKEALEQVGGSHGVISNVWSLTSNCLTDGASAGDKDSSHPIAVFGIDLCSQLLHMLAMLANASPKLGMDILAQPEVGQVLRSKILVEKPGEVRATENRRRSSIELSSRSSPQLLREIMALTSSLLPALPLFPPKEPTKVDSSKDGHVKAGKASKKARTTPAVASGLDVAVAAGIGVVDKGEEAKAHWTKNHDVLEQFGNQLLEATLSMGALSIDGSLRLDALTALCKLVHYMPGDKISTLLPRQQVCELMSALLASESLQLRFVALVLIHDLMSKCSDAFSSLFTREGIIYAVHKLQGGPGSSSALAKREQKVSTSSVLPSLTTMRPTVPNKSGNNMQEATEAVFEAMLAFVSDRHFPTSSGSKDGDERLTSVVSELRELGAAMVKAGEQGNEEAAKQTLEKIISYFVSSAKVSTFEMRCAGVCENLIRYLAPECPGSKGKVSDKGKDAADKTLEKSTSRGRGRKGGKTEGKSNGSPSALKVCPEAMCERWDLFVSLVSKKHDCEEGVTTPARALVHKLVAALNNTDGFGASPAPQQGSEAEASWSKQSRLITLPLRLRFERCATAKDSHKLKEYANPVVIDPLASVSAIHDFLWPRVRKLAHEIPTVAPQAPPPRSIGGRAEPSSSALASAPERPRRGAAAGKAAADESAESHQGRPKRETAKVGKGKAAAGVAAGAAASSSKTARESADAHDVPALRGSVPPWVGSAGLSMEDEMMSDGEGDLADGMPIDDMVTATLLGGAVDEEGFDHGEMEDDMDLDHEGEDEAIQAQRAQVLDIQLSNEGAGSSPPLPSSLSAHGGSGSAETSTRDRGGASANRATRGGSAAAAGSRGGGRAVSAADAGESSTSSSTHSSARAFVQGSASGQKDSGAGASNTPLGQGAGPHLCLSIGGRVIENHDMSIIEAVLMSLTATGCSSKNTAAAASSDTAQKSVSDPRSALWGSSERPPVHVVEYAPMTAKSQVFSCSEAEKGSSRMGLLRTRAVPDDEPVRVRASAILGEDSERGISLEDLGLPPITSAMLRLVAVLQSIHADLPIDDPCRVSAGELVVGNLSSKASCMIRDPLTVFLNKLPDWVRVLLTRFPFLVAHDVRQTFFDLEAFGLVRALRNAGRNRDGRPERQNLGHSQHRQKVRVGRQHILESAKHVMEIYTKNTERAGWTLEVEFSGEVGVGKGPTQEFFTFFCRELQQRKLGLWWDPMDSGQAGKEQVSLTQDEQGGPAGGVATGKSDLGIDHVCPAHGLFPAPMAAKCSPAERKKKIEAFQVMGWVCAKAIHDGRLLDLPVSTAFCHTLLDRPLECGDLALVCPDVYKSLLKLQKIVQQKKEILGDATLSDTAKAEAIKALTYDGVALEDLSLSFTVPGYDAVVLKEGGADILLTVDNVDEYVKLLPRVILVDSIRAQLDAFRNGFSRVFPMGSLRLFCGDELQELLGSEQGTLDWTPEQLLHVFKFEHGYKSSSSVARLLVQVLAELPIASKRKFISFCTGCPRLPVGGFAALKPPLTVVKKELPKDASQSARDMQLPSVMTCANYLKLPDYASYAVLRDRLLVAVNEADGSFHLS